MPDVNVIPTGYASTVAALTLEHIADDLVDAIHPGQKFLTWIDKSGKKTVGGGEKLRGTVQFDRNPNRGWVDDSSSAGLVRKQTEMPWFYDWARCYSQVVIGQFEQSQNEGPTQIMDMIRTKILGDLKDHGDMIESAIIHAGTTNDANAPLSLGQLTEEKADIGGIDSTKDGADERNPWWRPHVTANRTTSTTLTRNYLQAMFMEVSRGGVEHPDLVLTNQATYLQMGDWLWDKDRLALASSDLRGLEMYIDGFVMDGAMVLWTDNKALEQDKDGTAVAGKQNPLYVYNGNYTYMVQHGRKYLEIYPELRDQTNFLTSYMVQSELAMVASGRGFNAVSWQTK